jgi:hypothetical protein
MLDRLEDSGFREVRVGEQPFEIGDDAIRDIEADGRRTA